MAEASYPQAQAQAMNGGNAGQIESGHGRHSPDDEVVIAIMGVTGAGKSTFISLLSEESVEIGHGLDSRTADVKIHSFRHANDRIGYLIDTPGFDDTTRSDSEVLKETAYFLSNLYKRSKKLSGVIYLHRIIDPKMGGSAVKNLDIFQKMCGQSAFPNIMLVSTMWEELRPEIGGSSLGEQREAELRSHDRFWGNMVKGGSEIARHDGTVNSAKAIVSHMIDQNKVILDIQRQMVDQKLPLDKTVAGEFLEKEFAQARKQQEDELRDLKETMEAAAKENDQEMVDLLLEEKKSCESRLKVAHIDQQRLKVDFRALEEEQRPRYLAKIEQLKHENARATTTGVQVSDVKFLEQSLTDLQDNFERKEREHREQLSRMRREAKAQSAQDQKRLERLVEQMDQQWQVESMRMMAHIKAEQTARDNREKTATARSGVGQQFMDFWTTLFYRETRR